ncbi:hypothetical protein WKI65_11050 [Streptomyces sp. MS1.AVA.3]
MRPMINCRAPAASPVHDDAPPVTGPAARLFVVGLPDPVPGPVTGA